MVMRSGRQTRAVVCCATVVLVLAWVVPGTCATPVNKTCAGSISACPFGTLPGILDERRPVGERWKLLSSACPLQNYVRSYSPNKNTTRLSIVFLSDSMEYTMLMNFCRFLNGSMRGTCSPGATRCTKHTTYNMCKVNKTTIPFGQVYLPTLTPQEEVKLSASGRAMVGYRTKMGYARGNWSLEHPGVEPTLVVLGGGLWDLMRWHISPLMPANELKIRELSMLDIDTLQWWVNCARKAIRHARTLFPRSHFVWRSYATPHYNATGHMLHEVIGTKARVVQMRAAGEQAALEEGLELVDVQALAESYAMPEEYLQDILHPNQVLGLEVLNMLFNIATRVLGE